MGKHEVSDAEKKFQTQIGSQATVQRDKEKSEKAERANADLCEIGERCNPVPNGAKYMGSIATHIYYNETLSQAFFVSQTNTLRKTQELLAQAATKDLIGSVMEYFGKRRPKMRSGF